MSAGEASALEPRARRRASAAEAEIRSATVDFLHEHVPTARLIHELPISGARADLVAVLPCRLIVLELKSERDTLDRLADQLKQFRKVSEDVVVVAHRKFFDTSPYRNGNARCAWPSDAPRAGQVWAYPDGDDAFPSRWRVGHDWDRPARPVKAAWNFLDLLWADELRAICERHGFRVLRRTPRAQMMDMIVWRLAGGEIWPAVCRALRARDCLEADPPIHEATP